MKNNFVFIKTGRTKHKKLLLSEILYFKAMGSYTIIKLENDKIISSKLLKEFVDIIDDNSFLRINRSYIINLNKCVEINTSQKAEVLLCNCEKIRLSNKIITTLKRKLGIK